MFNLKDIINYYGNSPFHQQVEISNVDQCCRPYSACVSVDLGGGFKATGTTCSGGAVLLSLQGQDFPAPATLSGTTVVFSAADNAQLLSAVSGELGGLNSYCYKSISYKKKSSVKNILIISSFDFTIIFFNLIIQG